MTEREPEGYHPPTKKEVEEAFRGGGRGGGLGEKGGGSGEWNDNPRSSSLCCIYLRGLVFPSRLLFSSGR